MDQNRSSHFWWFNQKNITVEEIILNVNGRFKTQKSSRSKQTLPQIFLHIFACLLSLLFCQLLTFYSVKTSFVFEYNRNMQSLFFYHFRFRYSFLNSTNLLRGQNLTFLYCNSLKCLFFVEEIFSEHYSL